jgi:hypothetical protein
MTEVVRLQAQLQQLRTQFEETAKELEKTQKGLPVMASHWVASVM